MGEKEEDCREWDNLPGPALISVIKTLTNPLDFESFSSVCKSWRLFSSYPVAYKAFLSSQPPLLYLLYENRLFNVNERKTYGGIIHTKLAVRFCGVGFGHLILVDFKENFKGEMSVMNLSTKAITCGFPIVGMQLYHNMAVLTAPPEASDSVLLLFSELHYKKQLVSFAKRGDPGWSVIPFKNMRRGNTCISGGRLLVMSNEGQLFGINFLPELKFTLLDADVLHRPSIDWWRWEYFLVEFGDSNSHPTLVVLCNAKKCLFHVYKLDSSGQQWEKVDNLGSSSLFIDTNNCYCLENPNRWGLHDNCIYIYFKHTGMFIFDIKESKLEQISYDFHDSYRTFWILPSLFCK